MGLLMVIVDAKKLKMGMVLAQPVFNSEGLLLLREGIKLSEKNIIVLKSWGVAKVSIQGEENNTGRKELEEWEKVTASIEKATRIKFSGTTHDELMSEIMRVAIRLLQERYMRGRKWDESF